jgi:hypothetical protein
MMRIKQVRLDLQSTLSLSVFILVNSSSITKSSPPSSTQRFPIKLGNPPMGRRPINGTHPSTTPINDQASPSDQPPPIPPRHSLLNTTNKRQEGEYVRQGETPIKAKRTIFRSRNVKRREPITNQAMTVSKSTRSDSADALSVPSSESRYRHVSRRLPVQIEQGTNSD